MNAIRSQLRSGGAGRRLPHQFPKWQTVYADFRRWQADGTRNRGAGALPRDLRVALGRRSQAGAG